MSFSPGGGGGISSATDVALSSPVTDEALSYDGTIGKWKNAPVTKAQVGLSNVNNTSDASKPVSTATQTALNAKLAVAQSIPTIFATSATALPTRASGLPAGYTGRVAFDTADYPTHPGPTDMQVGDRWRRRVS